MEEKYATFPELKPPSPEPEPTPLPETAESGEEQKQFGEGAELDLEHGKLTDGGYLK